VNRARIIKIENVGLLLGVTGRAASFAQRRTLRRGLMLAGSIITALAAALLREPDPES